MCVCVCVCVCVTRCTGTCPPTIGKYTDCQMDLAQIKESFSRLVVFFFLGTELCKFLGRSILKVQFEEAEVEKPSKQNNET